ncbi:hypothetical protein BTJ39_12970 [Izhakiella australiensis]|uniref:AroM protein n=1 Tax=Izhakiella australiensis TaxID=1926881 RepID=A0A1S8YLJ7_9GAMM|nr:AroM family protein [Izhakiella australiensis]OON39563.1 hypothetical protein BTJ39_12970 [Izhakiella australiensis]
MTQQLITLGLGAEPASDIHPLLLEYLPEISIRHVSLLDGLSESAIEQRYAAAESEPVICVRVNVSRLAVLSAKKITHLLQEKITTLEDEGAETILLLCHSYPLKLVTRQAIVLEPDRVLPPLVKAIVDGHQVGIVISDELRLEHQQSKWRRLNKRPCFAVANPWQDDEGVLADAALLLQEQGADVVVLDCLGYHQQHRDFLQKLLGIPVLLTNTLVAKLAAELLS